MQNKPLVKPLSVLCSPMSALSRPHIDIYLSTEGKRFLPVQIYEWSGFQLLTVDWIILYDLLRGLTLQMT